MLTLNYTQTMQTADQENNRQLDHLMDTIYQDALNKGFNPDICVDVLYAPSNGVFTYQIFSKDMGDYLMDNTHISEKDYDKAEELYRVMIDDYQAHNCQQLIDLLEDIHNHPQDNQILYLDIPDAYNVLQSV